MRSLAQRGNQAKSFHRMPGVQRSPIAYNLQHLREYNSCRIWASQSRRPPYLADVEGRARIEGVAASIHESYMDAHGNTVAEDAVFKSPCVVIIFDEAPRYREVRSKHESKHPIMKAYRDRASRDAGGDTSKNKICCSVETSQMSQTQILSFSFPFFFFFFSFFPSSTTGLIRIWGKKRILKQDVPCLFMVFIFLSLICNNDDDISDVRAPSRCSSSGAAEQRRPRVMAKATSLCMLTWAKTTPTSTSLCMLTCLWGFHGAL